MKLVTVRTTAMAPSGEAVAHFERDGARRAVLVRGGAPGETVRARLDDKARPARGEIVEILEPGPGREAPACPFVEACGGCDWLHLSRRAQRDAHLALAEAAFSGVPVAFHEAPSALAYRARARIHARRGRLGYFGARSHDVVPVDACAVLDPRVEAARAAATELFRGARGDGELALALGKDRLPVAHVAWKEALAPEYFARIEAEVTARRWAGFSVTCEGASRPAIVGDPTPWIEGADGAPLELGRGGFSQANEAVNRALASRVSELACATRPKHLLELYAGAGNFTVLLARTSNVRAVESSELACEAARRNLKARALGADGRTAKVTCADASAFEIPTAADVVVLDPPRTGARDACARIAASRVRRVVYVSCDRATLARDAATLGARFRLASIDVFEMFPGTSHVETVVAFERP